MKKRVIAITLSALMAVSALGTPASVYASAVETETVLQTEAAQTESEEDTAAAEEETAAPDTQIANTELPDAAESETVIADSEIPASEIEETEVPASETEAESEIAEETEEIEPQETPEEMNTRAFVERMYTVVLGRSSDPVGINNWTEKLLSGEQTGAQIAYGFIFSTEFINKNYSNEEFIDILYKGMFNRGADATGKATWMEALENRMSRTYVLKGFVDSAEFKSLCESFGITPGTIELTSVTDQNPKTTQFVRYLYKNILNREPDMPGLSNWVKQLVEHTKTAAEVAFGFTNSDEFKKKNLSNEEYVDLLYATILGRSADAAGRKTWVNNLESGLSRNFILNGFTQSTEFKNMCDSYGIIAGKVAATEPRDQNANLTKYIYNAYVSIQGRGASVAELNEWATNILTNKYTTTILLEELVKSKNLGLSDADITAIYQAALGRTPSSSEISSAKSKDSALDLLSSITGGNEYRNKITNMGLSVNVEGWNVTSQGRYYVSGGQVLKGWQRINGDKYYFDTTTGYAYTGWQYLDGYKFYFETSGVLRQNVEDLIGYQSKYYLTVNCMTNLVTVYAKDGDNGYIIPVRAFVCSTGLDIYPTRKGTYTLSSHWRWGRMMGDVWAQYVTQISGDYLFHAVWNYYRDNKTMSIAQYNLLGDSASHGCVRLTVEGAKWIYDNCLGSTVYLSNYGIEAPFDQPAIPAPVRISGDMGYDPTDPNI